MKVVIDYTNWRGERRERTIEPIQRGIVLDSNQYHPERQWLLHAYDEDGKVKTFAMSGIHSWRAA